MAENDLKVAGLIRNLVESFGGTQSAIDEKCKLWIHLKNSPSYQANQPGSEIRKRFQRRVSRSCGPSGVANFEELYQQFRQFASEQLITNFLSIILHTDSSTRKKSSTSSRISTSSMLLAAPSPSVPQPLPPQPLPPQRLPPRPLPPLESLASSSGVSSGVTGVPDYAHEEESNSESSNSQRTIPHVEQNFNRALGARNFSEPDSRDRIEALLVSDLLYVLNGANGKYIQKNSNETGYHIDEALSISPCDNILVQRIVECALYYNNISKICRSADEKRGVRGNIACQFFTALSEQICEHIRLLACLATEIKSMSPKVSLARMNEWCYSVKPRLSLQYRLALCAQTLQGGQLLTELYKHASTCQPCDQRLILSLIGCTCKPLVTHLSKWIGLGVIDDPYGEFFIQSMGNVDEEDIWDGKFKIDQRMVPSFLTQKHCVTILLAGKSTYFMRTQCMQNCGNEKLALVQDKISNMDQDLLFDPFKQYIFDDLINVCCNEISGYLLDLLKNKFKLMDHLQILHKYILLNHGEFAYCLIEHVSHLLGQPAENVLVSEWSSALEKSLVQTSLNNPSQTHLLNKIAVEKLEPSSGENGWQVFMLKYRVDGPLSVIIDHTMQKNYSRVFAFVLKLKRLVFLVSETKKLHRFTSNIKKRFPELSAVFLQFDLLSAEMYHFVREMHSNVMEEVLTCSWKKVESAMQEATDLDSVRDCVSSYLQHILDECLLNDRNNDETGNLQTEMGAIMNTVLDMCDRHSDWMQEIEAAISLDDQFEEERLRQIKLAKFADTENMQIARQSKRQKFIDTIFATYPTKFQQLSQQFRGLLQRLLIDLANSENERLRGLCLRLDMSHFYRSRNKDLVISLCHRRQSMITARSKHAGAGSLFDNLIEETEVFTPVKNIDD